MYKNDLLRIDILNKARQCMAKYPSLRFGQCVFNVGTQICPFITNWNGSKDDCFYDDSKVEAFLSHIEENP